MLKEVEYKDLVENKYNPRKRFDDAAMVSDQANQTIGLIYKAGATLYVLDVKTGVIGDYTATPSASPYNALFNVYAVLSSSELAEKRYIEVWTYAMSLYIAHKLQLRFTALSNVGSVTNPTVKARLLASANSFVASSESVGGVSVSYDTGVTLATTVDGGDWNRTQYGQELMTIVSAYSMGAWLVGL